MIVAAVHLPPAVVIPIAVVVAVLVVLYWWRLGFAQVPFARRKIRRVTLVVILVTLPVLVRALSYLDPAIEPTQYVVSWLVVLGAMVLLIVLSILDVVITAHVHAAEQEASIRRDAPDLFKALQNEIDRNQEGDHHA